MDDRPTVIEKRSKFSKFVDDLFDDAQEARLMLKEDDDCKIKERITCLKYLEEIAKTYIGLEKAATDDPAAAGATVRKYATAFAQNATRGGKKGRGRRTADIDESDSDGDSLGDDAA